MRQMTLAHQAEFQRYSKKTRREQFLEEMDAVMPWAELLALVEPHYPKGETGRKPVGLDIMLRVYFPAAVVRAVGPRRGRCVVRIAGAAPLCRHRSGPRPGAGRDDDS